MPILNFTKLFLHCKNFEFFNWIAKQLSQIFLAICARRPFYFVSQVLFYWKTNLPVSFPLSFSIRAHLNYDLSLFVVKNLCYIFMLMHSLYPGMVYVLTGKPCGHLVVYPGARSEAIETNEKQNPKNPHNDSGSSNEIEMLPMQRNSLQRNLNRVSQPPPQACESGDEGSP